MKYWIKQTGTDAAYALSKKPGHWHYAYAGMNDGMWRLFEEKVEAEQWIADYKACTDREVVLSVERF